MAWQLIAAAVVSAAGDIMAGEAGVDAAKINRKEYRRLASNERARAQREAYEIRRAGEATLSRLRAVAVGGQGTTSDYGNPVIESAKIEGQFAYDALVSLWNGADRAYQLERRGEIEVSEARAARKVSYMKAIGKGFSAYGQMGSNPPNTASGGFSSYAGQPPSGSFSSAGGNFSGVDRTRMRIG